MEVEASLGLVSLSTNIYCDKLEEMPDFRVFLNSSAGHIWPEARYLPISGLEIRRF